MLPDLRAVIAATVVVVGLLLAGFGLAATFRVAQESRSSPLQVARSAVLIDPALRREDLIPALAQEETAPANDDTPAETASIAPNIAPPVEAATVAPSVAPPPAEEPPAPPVAIAVAPDTTDAIAALLQSDAVVAAAPAAEAPPAPALAAPAPVTAVTAPPQAAMPAPVPAAEPPVGGPLEQASLNPAETPDAKPAVKKKPRVASAKKRAAQKKARARAAAKRAAARRTAVNPSPQAPFSQPWTGFTQQQQ